MFGNNKEVMKYLTDFGTIGLSMASCVFIGLGMGYYLDHKVFNNKTTPWFTLIFLGLGIFAGFRNLWRMAHRKDLNQ